MSALKMQSCSKTLFHFDWMDYVYCFTSVENLPVSDMSEMIQRSTRRSPAFNDSNVYKTLKSTKGCVRVDIARVLLHLSNHKQIMGLQVHYRSTFSDGSTITTLADNHLFSKEFANSPNATFNTQEFVLADDEYITDVLTCRDDVVDQVTFVTNKGRKESFGRHNMLAVQQMPRDRQLHARVISLCGTQQGGLHRLGFVAELPRNWNEIGHLIILRQLLEKDRAQTKKEKSKRFRRDTFRRAFTLGRRRSVKKSFPMCMEILFAQPEDVFRYVLTFLAPNPVGSVP